MNTALIKQVLRFGIVGVTNTGVDLIVLNGLIFSTGLGQQGIYYTIFKAISFLVAATNSYFLNKHWTFAGSDGGNATRQFQQFVAITIVGWLINVGVASFVVNIIQPTIDLNQFAEGMNKLWPSIGALFGTAFGLVWNFLGYKLIVFRKRSA